MTDPERAELDGFQRFVDVLGVSELEDQEFERYLALLELKKTDGGAA